MLPISLVVNAKTWVVIIKWNNFFVKRQLFSECVSNLQDEAGRFGLSGYGAPYGLPSLRRGEYAPSTSYGGVRAAPHVGLGEYEVGRGFRSNRLKYSQSAKVSAFPAPVDFPSSTKMMCACPPAFRAPRRHVTPPSPKPVWRVAVRTLNLALSTRNRSKLIYRI